MAPKIGPKRKRLATRLRELRAVEHASGSALAKKLGWIQSRVSKLETGVQLPTAEDLDAWTAATGAGGEARAELTELLAAARLEYRSWQDAWQRPGAIATGQDEIAAEESAATRIAEFQPALVPGLAQTPAYARELLSAPAGPVVLGAGPEEIEALVAARMRRQQVLYTPGKRIQIVMGEAALHTWFGSRDTLRGQLDRLTQLAGMSTVELGVLPFAAANPLPGFAGFALLDSENVFVETLTGEQRLDSPDEVTAYVKALEMALDAAATGDQALELIRAAAK